MRIYKLRQKNLFPSRLHNSGRAFMNSHPYPASDFPFRASGHHLGDFGSPVAQIANDPIGPGPSTLQQP